MPKPRIPIPDALERRLDDILDRALRVEAPVISAYVDRVRRQRPHASPAEVVELLERRYRQAVMGIGAASGAVAVVPGVGTATALASGGAEVAAFVSATAMYVLGLARVYGVPIHDPEVRRALVFAVLLGEGSLATLGGAEFAGKHWPTLIARQGGGGKLTGLNGKMTRIMVRRFTTRQGALLIGRALPMGIGAGVGAVGNAALARGAIKSAHRAFGAPPATFGPRIIEGTPVPGE